MNSQVELLSQPVNYAVVQLPERKFPGVVVQGDTLNSLVDQLDRMLKLLHENRDSELAAELMDMREQLGGSLAQYEKVCAALGRDLPYRKS
jgi:predicted RNase H-like HicB family nuclease